MTRAMKKKLRDNELQFKELGCVTVSSTINDFAGDIARFTSLSLIPIPSERVKYFLGVFALKGTSTLDMVYIAGTRTNHAIIDELMAKILSKLAPNCSLQASVLA